MTFREIFNAAVGMVCESVENGDCADYEERAPYLLAAACNECAASDRSYRMAHGADGGSYSETVCVGLDDAFPLADALATGVTYYLAAMLVLDENEEMSDRFFSLFCDTLSRIRASLPAKPEAIGDRYGLK